MPTIQIHYDGWLSLPEDARKHLGIVTGSRLEIELTTGALMLRPSQQARKTIVAEVAAPIEPKPIEAAATPAKTDLANEEPKRGPGRPRKTVTQELAPRIKAGGRRKSSPPE